MIFALPCKPLHFVAGRYRQNHRAVAPVARICPLECSTFGLDDFRLMRIETDCHAGARARFRDPASHTNQTEQSSCS